MGRIERDAPGGTRGPDPSRSGRSRRRARIERRTGRICRRRGRGRRPRRASRGPTSSSQSRRARFCATASESIGPSPLRALAENCRSVRKRRRARLSKEAKCFRQSGLKLADSTVNGARVFRADPALNTTFSDYLSTRVHVLTYTYTFTTRAPSRSSSSAPGSPRATRFCSTHRSCVPRSGTNSGSSSANPIR